MSKRWLLVSILVHLILLRVILFLISDERPSKASVSAIRYVDIERLIPPHKLVSKQVTRKRGKRSKGSSVSSKYPKRLKDLFGFKIENMMPKSFEDEDSEQPMQFHGGESGADFLSKSNLVLPHMEFLWVRIKEKIFYHEAILFRHLQGVVEVRVHIDRYGKLIYLNEASLTGNDEILRGWVVKGITEALAQPILRKPMARPVELILKFNFRIFPMPPAKAVYAFDRNHLNFDINGFIPSAHLDPEKFEAVVSWPAYPMARTRSMERVEVDFFARLKMYVDACDMRSAEGGCFEAAKIYEKLNKKTEAALYFEKACRLGIEQACH